MQSTGYVDVLTNGWITLNEASGDLRVGRIRSTADDVLLYAPGRMVDALSGLTGDTNSVVADVSGRNITMVAGTGLVLDGTIDDPLFVGEDITRGGIGETNAFLEIDVDTAGTGTGVLRAFDRTATAGYGIFLTETIGDLRLYEVNTLGDVALTTTAGSILDARNATPGTADVAQVYGNSIDLDANGAGASIGAAGNDVEIESSHQATGDVGLEADGSIRLTETRGTLNLVLANAKGGDVVLTVRETVTTTPKAIATGHSAPNTASDKPVTFNGATLTCASCTFVTDGFLANTALTIAGGTPYDGAYSIVSVTETAITVSATLWAHSDLRTVTLTAHDTLDEDLALLHSGSVRFAESGSDAPRTVSRGRIAATGAVTLRVGDDVTTTMNSEIVAGGAIDVFGDWTNGDPNYGSTMVFRGDITAGYLVVGSVTNIWGDTDVDTISFGDSTGSGMTNTVGSPGYIHLGSQTRVHGSPDADLHR